MKKNGGGGYPKLLNWWPARGPLPKRMHEPKYVLPVPVVTDGPIKRSAMSESEKGFIEAMATATNVKKTFRALNGKRVKSHRRWSKPVKLKKLKKRYYSDFFLNHHIESVASIPFETARCLIIGGGPWKEHQFIATQIEPTPITITLDYPLSRAVTITIKPYELHGHKYMDLGYVLWQVAKQYQRIYKQHKRYGVWGHMLDDLWFERLMIKKNGQAELFIGS